MARAVKSEIVDMRSSDVVDALRKDADDAKTLGRIINKFVNNSTNELAGPNYDEAREIAAKYVLIMQNRAQVADAMADAIKSGCSSLASYMGKFAILDEAERDEYQQRLDEAKSALAALSAINWDDDEYNWFDYWGAYFSYKRIISECEEYLEKLNGLPGADASAYGPIVDAANSFVTTA